MTGCKNNSGYTLVEAIVAMGIFVLIAVLAAGIFTSILGAQTKTVQEQGAASQLRYFQDIASRDIRAARTLTCNNPDPVTREASSFTLSLNADGSDPITYTLDTTQTPHVIKKVQNNIDSPLTDIEITDFEVFCTDLGNSKAFVTINVLAQGAAQPYQVSITPRVGVMQ